MENLPLHRKYRPQTFDDVIGNESLIVSLKTIIKKDVTTLLFQGPSGCGKTTLARIVGKELGARDQDIIELNVARQGGIQEARNIIDNARFKPFGGKVKVYILDEIQGGDPKARVGFQNALLKILEEPPKGVYFILCTTEPGKLLSTVISRCTTFQVRSLTITEMGSLLKKVLIEEGRRGFPKEALKEIADVSDGCPREALKILDSVISIDDNEKILEAINDFSIGKKEVIELCRALLGKKKWKEVSVIIKSLDEEPESVRYAVLGYMASVLLNKDEPRAFLIMEEFKQSFMYTKKGGLVSACYAVCNM